MTLKGLLRRRTPPATAAVPPPPPPLPAEADRGRARCRAGGRGARGRGVAARAQSMEDQAKAMAEAQDRWQAQLREGKVRSVTSKEAGELLKDGWTMLDVRPKTEVENQRSLFCRLPRKILSLGIALLCSVRCSQSAGEPRYSMET